MCRPSSTAVTSGATAACCASLSGGASVTLASSRAPTAREVVRGPRLRPPGRALRTPLGSIALITSPSGAQ